MADETQNIQPQGATTTATTETWYDSLNLTDEGKGLIQAHNFKTAEDLLKSYKNLESFTGVDKNELIRIPKAKEGEEVDYSAVYDALGRPKTAAEYGLPDTDFAKAAAEQMYKMGLTAKQAKGLSDWVETYSKEQGTASQQAREEELEKQAQTQIAGLQKDWGKDYDLNIEIAKQAVADYQKELGLDADVLDKLGDYIGVDRATKLFYALGKARAGDGSKNVVNYATGSGNETAEIAAYKLKEMYANPETAKKISAGDSKMIAELNRLNKIVIEAKLGVK